MTVIEVAIEKGSRIQKDDTVVTLESDKASMELPAPYAGVVQDVVVAVGDKVREGSVLAHMAIEGGHIEISKTPASSSAPPAASAPVQSAPDKAKVPAPSMPAHLSSAAAVIYAGPAARRFARELGVPLERVTGSARKGRIIKDDIKKYVKTCFTSGSMPNAAPEIDFSQFGDVEKKPLSKIKRLTAIAMSRAWTTAPQVTQFDEADITELEAFRQSKKAQAAKEGYKLTVLAFIAKAVVEALQQFPQFNASLDARGETVIYKIYCHLGIAVDTPHGLFVPVIKYAQQKNVSDLAREIIALSQKAQAKKLLPGDMQGGSFTISSLGGICGTGFTPIVNVPEVAILGVSRSKVQAVYRDGSFVPRLMLPLALSYDHRLIDGAEAARFTACVSAYLSDIKNLLL